MMDIKVFDETPEEFYLWTQKAFETRELTPGEMALVTASIEMPRITCMSVKFFRKELEVHNCPLCGEKTEGSYSEGGVHFDICEQCYQERYQEKEDERRLV